MWLYKNKEYSQYDKQYIGFVYLITNTLNNRKYIGKKLFLHSKIKQVKGKKKRFKVESDWLTYYGSSETLKRDVAECGIENFRREILHFCRSKGECNYLEAKEQFARGVLESSEYYNNWISVKVHDAHIKNLLT